MGGGVGWGGGGGGSYTATLVVSLEPPIFSDQY